MTTVERKLGIAGAVTIGAVAVGSLAGREAVRRARARPDAGWADHLAERPGRERTVESFDGTRLSVRVAGPEGNGRPTVVFVHGFSSDLTVWHYQWRRFASERRCVLFDQRGHGRSGPAGPGGYSLEALGRDLRAVMDAVAPSDAIVLVGHSMGGMAVISFAALYPDEVRPGGRVRGAVLANTAASGVVRELLGLLGVGVGRAVVRLALRAARNPARLYRVRARLLREGSDLAFLTVRVTNFGPHAPPSAVEHVARIAGRAPVEAWADLLTGIVEMDLGHALNHIEVPVLLVASDLDRLTPPTTALAMQRRLPNARLAAIDGAGHCAMIERPEAFNGLLAEFLQSSVPLSVGREA